MCFLSLDEGIYKLLISDISYLMRFRLSDHYSIYGLQKIDAWRRDPIVRSDHYSCRLLDFGDYGGRNGSYRGNSKG